MTRTINSSVQRAIVRAWFEGMTLVHISELFKVSYEDTIHSVFKYMTNPIKGVRNA